MPEGKQWSWRPHDVAWIRVYHCDPHTLSAKELRTFGPKHRFDHHQPDFRNPDFDPDGRGVLYLAKHLSTALVEVFQNKRAFVCPNYRAADVRVTASVELQELREGGALAIGALSELSTGSVKRTRSQEWARAIYDQLGVAGVHYSSAHDEGECLALWERAPSLDVIEDDEASQDFPLLDAPLWARVESALPPLGFSLKAITVAKCAVCRRHGLTTAQTPSA